MTIITKRTASKIQKPIPLPYYGSYPEAGICSIFDTHRRAAGYTF
jgi:hypothetical protein